MADIYEPDESHRVGGHAVSLVGWGTEYFDKQGHKTTKDNHKTQKRYWLVRNSWGLSFDKNNGGFGYCKFAFGIDTPHHFRTGLDIPLSVQGKYEGVPLTVDTAGMDLLSDLPTLVDNGASVEGETLWWEEGEEPQALEPYLDNGEIQIFDLLNDPEVIQAAIATTGTAVVLKGISPEQINK